MTCIVLSRSVNTLVLLGSLLTGQASVSPQIPGDATSIQEVYDNWTVACAQKDGKRACALVQHQMDKDSRQRALAFELNAVTAEKGDGTLLLPFGLAVNREVVLQVDGAALGSPLHFRTCVPTGCFVSLTFDARKLGALKKGASLTVTVTADGGQPVTFTLPMKGFASAYDRTVALTK